jgi:DNA-binding IclR family transcriptional regulator
MGGLLATKPRLRGKATLLETTSTRNDEALLVRALSKGLLVLSLYDADHREWSLDQIVDQTRLPRMTAYRMVRTLESAMYLVRDPVTKRYHAGPAVIALMYLRDAYSELVRIARPYLEALAEETGETATLAVEVDGVAVSVDMVNTTRPFKRELTLGRIIGDTGNCSGKVFAAFKSPAERELLVASPHAQLTPNTITDQDALATELEQIARSGVAFDIEERDIGTCAVAAPIRDQLGAVVAAMALVAPTGRFGLEERTRYAEAVKGKANSLSAYLGYSAHHSSSEGVV